MSYQATDAVMNGPRTIKGACLAVLAAMAEWADEDGIVVSRDGEPIYVPVIAAQARCCDRSAQRALHWLEQEGYIKIQIPERAKSNGIGNGKGNENAYKIELTELKKRRSLEDRARGDNITPIGRGRGDMVSPKGAVRGANLSPKEGLTGDTESPKDRSRGVNLSPNERGIKEPYLTTVKNPVESDVDGSIQNRETSPTTYPTQEEKWVTSSHDSRSETTRENPSPERAGANAPHSPPRSRVAAVMRQDYEVSAELLEAAVAMAAENGVELRAALLAARFKRFYKSGDGKTQQSDNWDGKWNDWVEGEIGRILDGRSDFGSKKKPDGPGAVRDDMLPLVEAQPKTPCEYPGCTVLCYPKYCTTHGDIRKPHFFNALKPEYQQELGE